MAKQNFTNTPEFIRETSYLNGVAPINDLVYSSNASNQFNHNSRYEDYDSRPIKPLDTNLLQKQLEQYTELTQDELEEIRKKSDRFFF